VAEIHHFTFGLLNPVVAFVMAFLGSVLGLGCAVRARAANSRGRAARWLVLAAISIGGGGIWLMHFTAMLGFDVPSSPVRYDPQLTFASSLLGVLPVGLGLFVVVGLSPGGQGRRPGWRLPRLLIGGILTGLGVFAMHYTGMAAMRVGGRISYDPGLVAASGIIAVVAATVALAFTTSVRGWWPILISSVIMAVAVCGMHYTGMAAMRVRLPETATDPIDGLSPFLLIVPITVITAATVIGTAFSGLQAMTEEEFDAANAGRRGGAHTGTAVRLRARVAVDSPAPNDVAITG
jgi:NO-binding membrane sensor protein with MHYT domain